MPDASSAVHDAQTYTLDFSEIAMRGVFRVDGKNASLGELFNALKPKGIGVLDGFATTANAYWRLLSEQGLRENCVPPFRISTPKTN